MAEAVVGSAGVRILGMGVTFLVGVQLARYLGPEGYGIYGTVMAVAALLIVPAQLGLPQLLTREVSAYMARNDYGRVKGAIVWFSVSVVAASLAMMMIGLAGYGIWKGLSQDVAARAFYWGLAIIPLFALTNLTASILRGFHRIVTAQIFDALLRPLMLAGFLFFMASELAGVGVVDALMLQALAALIVTLISAIVVYRIMPETVLSTRPLRRTKEWRKSAMPMAGTEILRVFDGQYGILLLGLMVSIADVGVFRVALGMAAFLGLPSTIINLVTMPYVARFHAAQEKARMQSLAAGSAALMFASTLVLFLLVYLIGEPLIALVFGTGFVSAWPVLIVMALAYLVNSFFGSTATILNMSGGERSVTFVFGVGLFVGLPLAWILTLELGIIGVAWSMLVAELVRGAIMWKRVFQFHSIDSSLTGLLFYLRAHKAGQKPLNG